MLTASDKSTLLKFARAILQRALAGGSRRLNSSWIDELLPQGLGADIPPSGIFVTLMSQGALRGCMGSMESDLPLAQAAARTVLQSAFSDPRFPPLSEKELASLEIEISVLSPLKRAASIAEITPKIHGVLLKQDLRSGVFLPQVWEQLPEKADFLRELCTMKAGLRESTLADPKTEIYTFTVDHFSDGTPKR